MPDDRGRGRHFPSQRPRNAPGPGPFVPRGASPGPFPARPSPAPGARAPLDVPHSVRLRDGEREIEVSGSAAFVRQLLDDLPALLARLRSEPPSRPPSISMPPPPAGREVPPREAPAPVGLAEEPGEEAEPAPTAANGRRPADDLTRQVLGVLRRAGRPMGIAEIRRRLPEEVSGQQVRRVLERAADQVVNTGGRPAEYRLR